MLKRTPQDHVQGSLIFPWNLDQLGNDAMHPGIAGSIMQRLLNGMVIAFIVTGQVLQEIEPVLIRLYFAGDISCALSCHLVARFALIALSFHSHGIRYHLSQSVLRCLQLSISPGRYLCLPGLLPG